MTIVAYRPFPADALRKELAAAQDVIVVEKSIAVGLGGPLANNVDSALRNLPRAPRLHSAVAGLGGRPITKDCSTACSGGLPCNLGKARISSISMSASSAAKFIAPARCAAPAQPPKTSCASSRNPPSRLPA